jgi:hypothetical protein
MGDIISKVKGIMEGSFPFWMIRFFYFRLQKVPLWPVPKSLIPFPGWFSPPVGHYPIKKLEYGHGRCGSGGKVR